MPLPKLHLISHPLCPYVQRARIVLSEKSIPHRLSFIDLANKPAWFLDISPLGKVPVLLVDERPLFESAPISEYLDEISPGALLPEAAFDRARSRAWIQVASTTLGAIAALYRAPDDAQLEHAVQALDNHFAQLERTLAQPPYFDGAKFSLVDAAFGPVFRYFDVIDRYADFGLFDDRPKVHSWRAALRERPSVRSAVAADYPERLEHFLLARNSRLSEFILDAELQREAQTA